VALKFKFNFLFFVFLVTRSGLYGNHLKADFIRAVRERNQADGLGSSLPPPAPFESRFGLFLHRPTPAVRALTAALSQY
jgi:hypothetical protein